ncbi:nitrate/nitrite transporter [Chelatococcus sp. SYSU_G07232]|uniref:Nitrate/nitrite transporter n=1 Tax=Chelatococcus albus TaxID=3047466 RepID=A0ABT7ACA4_9HYPH|nr:nitrate/nitrite transporter [Chelatococcus sp. SYSU_G07232]MDJ1156996.1 nitrate/nitrite transporter [Chelatococcus sp. SYSU_G07232]
MNLKDFKKAGHWPTLLAAFLYFDISFMAWVALGPLIIYITAGMNLPVEDKFTLVAIPVLAGALLRVPLGTIADHIGSKRTGVIAQVLVILATAWVLFFGLGSPAAIAIFGLTLGIAGASFAVALPQASRWYPPHYQGVVMGIAGAGNMGVVLDTLFAPWLAETYGWQSVFGVLLVPMIAILAFYIFAAKDAPDARKPVSWGAYKALLGDADSRWFMFFYFITFGGFVGLANALPLYFTVHYHLSGVAAGLLVAFIVACGSGFRPVGGYIADRVGGIRTLSVLFAVVAACYFAIATLPAGPAGPADGFGLTGLPAVAWTAVLLFSVGVLALGMGNGAVFQLLPQRFRREIGIMTGLVGCAGGVGGFFLAKTLGVAKGMTGSFASGFIFFGVLALLGFAGLALVKARWRTTWGAVSGARI